MTIKEVGVICLYQCKHKHHQVIWSSHPLQFQHIRDIPVEALTVLDRMTADMRGVSLLTEIGPNARSKRGLGLHGSNTEKLGL